MIHENVRAPMQRGERDIEQRFRKLEMSANFCKYVLWFSFTNDGHDVS